MKILAEPIDVIAKFISKEKPDPIKFRYTDDNGKEKEIKVDKVLEVEEVREYGVKSYVYRCQSEIASDTKRYELKYIIDKCRWELFKM